MRHLIMIAPALLLFGCANRALDRSEIDGALSEWRTGWGTKDAHLATASYGDEAKADLRARLTLLIISCL